MRVREATPGDATTACDVLRRSIVELCRTDHRDDLAVLEAWLANKTVATVAAWIADPGQHVVVATGDDGSILGVGMASAGGTIELNYVSPDARFRGVSKAIVGALEARLTSLGHGRCTLVSTATARRLYAALGYRDDGPPRATFGVATSQPMIREL